VIESLLMATDVFLRAPTLTIVCLLSILSLCKGLSPNQDERYGQAAQLGASGLDAIQANISIAIATTVLHPGPLLPVWLDYHLRWVQHIMVYMDDAEERPEFERLCEDRPVTLLAGSQVEPQMTPESRLICRQVENMEHAIEHLTELGFTWLLHIDMDELLYGPLVDSRAWATDPGVGLVTFTNHEALPVDFETQDPFRDCEYFWVNGVDRNANFLAYGNGKSAVRLGRGVEPRGPHSFAGHAGRAWAPPADEAMVLHYPYPSYGRWLRKFQHYGRFPEYWFGDRWAGMILDFMRRSRDEVQKAQAVSDWTNARAFFDEKIPDPASRDEAMAQGKIRRYTPFADRGEDCGGLSALSM
jgi:hypothetical protein